MMPATARVASIFLLSVQLYWPCTTSVDLAVLFVTGLCSRFPFQYEVVLNVNAQSSRIQFQQEIVPGIIDAGLNKSAPEAKMLDEEAIPSTSVCDVSGILQIGRASCRERG